MSTSNYELLSVLDGIDDYNLKQKQDLIIESLGGIRKILKLITSTTATISDTQSQKVLDVVKGESVKNNNIATPTRKNRGREEEIKNQSVDEFNIHSDADNDNDNDDDDEKLISDINDNYDNVYTSFVLNKPPSIEHQKLTIMAFCTKYGNDDNWSLGKKENGIQKYILVFDNKKEPIQVRMSFLYSMSLYLSNIIGINKRCITHAFILCKSVKSQIKSLSEEFKLLQKTLLHHNDDILWSYFYSFMINFYDNFDKLEKYIGTRTDIDLVSVAV